MAVPPSVGLSSGPSAGTRPSPGDVTPTGAANSKSAFQSQAAAGVSNGSSLGVGHTVPLSARRAEPFDLSSVERRGQPSMKKDRPKRNRHNYVADAPTFRPTEEEFREPLEYIRKISREGRKYGIIKIIPPDSWNPEFAINTERFHFRTRRQELSSVTGGNRVNNDYLDQLAKFHKLNGNNLNRFPSVDKRPLDLYRLKKTVERRGGFDKVCKHKGWAGVGRDLGYSGKIMSSLSTSLKNSYQKWLQPYEEYIRLHKPGVQQQMEMRNGGPYTPSPVKKPQTNIPPGSSASPPAMQGSPPSHIPVNGHGPQARPIAQDWQYPPPNTGGGFTPVNSGGFTPANAQTPPAYFSPAYGSNVFHSNNATPQRATETPPNNNSHPPLAPRPNGVGNLKRQHEDTILTPEEVEAIKRRSKRLRQEIPTVAGSNMHHSRMSAARLQAHRDRVNFRPGAMCENCGRAEEPLKFVTCHTCDCVYHMYCLEPPLKQKPDDEWHCARCLVGTNEYGFEEGDVYSLAGFQKKADDFKAHHFSSIPREYLQSTDAKQGVSEDDVEREFWRLVEDRMDTTEVEYGADIHSTTHGSGFPTIEKQPRDPYAVDPWNLNILPLERESLFRHIKSDISGMTVPWLYVGMIFSTFCWHNEDHFAYSVNYQHFGDTKTWYGIPGADSQRFEKAMRDEVPELFETQPDLLFQLVTLAKPERLRQAGVRVYAADQHAGEFVITFPRAYHAGFNHGFNFNEAVNFAPHDWEPFGESGVRRLREYRKQPCFSHDELLLTAAAQDQSLETARWLAPAMERMRDGELATRKQFLDGSKAQPGAASQEPYLGPRYESSPELIDAETEEDEIICAFCKCYCYLSRYKCQKTGKYLCSMHAGGFECCDALEHERYTGRDGTHKMYYRMTDDELHSMVATVVERARVLETWSARVDAELDDNPRPSLKHLRTLLAEGERIQCDLPQLPDLRRFVERCNEWVEEATVYITRKQQNRRKNEKAWRKGNAKAAELEERDRELRNVENIRKLLEAADDISFDCPEIDTLRVREESIAVFRRDANAALYDIRAMTTAEFGELLERGRAFHVDMPEVVSIERLVKRLKWDDLAKTKRPHPENRLQDLTLADIEEFIADGEELGVPESNLDMVFFRDHLQNGRVWEEKAKELMAAEHVHYQQLDSLSLQAACLPINPKTLTAVDEILKKQREVQDRIVSLLKRSKHPDFRKRPLYKELKDVLDELEELQSKPNGTIDLEKEQKRHEDWMRKGKKLFGKANAPLHILLQHMNIVKDHNESCFDITDMPRMPVEPSSRANTPEEGKPISDGSNSSRDVFCICRRSEAGMMIECEACHEWYHGKCLKIARGKVKEEDKYTCPICDWRVKIPRDAARPKLEDLQAWQDELEVLPFQPDEEETLATIIDNAQTYRDFIKPIIHPDQATTLDELDTSRFHLRKIEGADILLTDETNFLRQEVHRWAPMAPEAPPNIMHSASTRKPRPTKQQKLMAQLGITNPDDLPQEYRIKQHISKKKPEFGQHPTFQVVGPSAPFGEPRRSLGGESRPSSAHNSANGSGPAVEEKRFLTPLAVHVLGDLASASVVSQLLSAEPHMNREKLNKVKTVLEIDRTVWDDLPAFMTKLNNLPTPSAHTPGLMYETAGVRGAVVTSSYRDSPLFQTTSMGTQTIRAPHDHLQSSLSHATPPPPSFDTTMFGGPHTSMFGSPSNDHRPEVTSPDFGGRSSIFDSLNHADFHHPAHPHSPGSGGSQHYEGHVDNVFADLVHDSDTLGGLDGADDARETTATVYGADDKVKAKETAASQIAAAAEAMMEPAAGGTMSGGPEKNFIASRDEKAEQDNTAAHLKAEAAAGAVPAARPPEGGSPAQARDIDIDVSVPDARPPTDTGPSTSKQTE